MTDYPGTRAAGNLRELAAEVEVPCVSRRVVIGVFFIPEIRISLLTYYILKALILVAKL